MANRPPPKPRDPAKEAKLAAALRANLRRRKAATAAAKPPSAEDGAD